MEISDSVGLSQSLQTNEFVPFGIEQDLLVSMDQCNAKYDSDYLSLFVIRDSIYVVLLLFFTVV